MKQKRNIYFLLLACIFIGLVGCEAPHKNPLDPISPDYIVAKLSGVVRTVSFPNDPLSDVEIFWKNDNTLLKTDQNGTFSLQSLERKDGWLYFYKQGYADDSLFIEWDGNPSVSFQYFLNANPVLDSIMLFTEVINNFPDDQIFYLGVNVKVHDDEDELDTVFIRNEYSGFRSSLVYNPATKFYESIFSTHKLNVLSLEELMGKPFDIIVKDTRGNEFVVGQKNISRIIKQLINYRSPSNNNEVKTPITLNWERFIPGFQFSYYLQIYNIISAPERVWEASGISSEEIFYTVGDDFPAGDYYWVVWCIDEYGNKCRSKRASFQIID